MTQTLNHRAQSGARHISLPICLLLLSPWPLTNAANAQPRLQLSDEPLTVPFGGDPKGSDSPIRDDQAEDLADRLIRGESANEDIMARIIKQMSQVEQRLSTAFDPGAETQHLQKRIVDRLDEAIAASIQQGSRGGTSAGSMGDKRRRTPNPMDRRPSDGTPRPPSSGDPQGSHPTGSPTKGDPQQTDRSGPLRDSRRGWGHLPPRDRDEVLQGINEKSLERFRQWIERYYQALAEKDDQ